MSGLSLAAPPGYESFLVGRARVVAQSALADAVCGLLGDEPRRVVMARAARQLAESRYAWPDIAGRLEAIYERALA